MQELVELFESDHRNPINRAIHFWIGMPLVGFGLLLFVFLKWQGAISVALGYGAMFFGHYRLEKNPPTVVKNPLGPTSCRCVCHRPLICSAVPPLTWRAVSAAFLPLDVRHSSERWDIQNRAYGLGLPPEPCITIN